MSIQFGPFEIPDYEVFWRGTHTFAIVNLRPIVPHHLLVCPFRKVSRFADLTCEEVHELMTITAKISQQLNNGCCSIGVQDGPEAGQSVCHVHVHIIPRVRGTALQVDSTGQNRTPEEMEQEAGDLKRILTL